jgi:hypothetical protein
VPLVEVLDENLESTVTDLGLRRIVEDVSKEEDVKGHALVHTSSLSIFWIVKVCLLLLPPRKPASCRSGSEKVFIDFIDSKFLLKQGLVLADLLLDEDVTHFEIAVELVDFEEVLEDHLKLDVAYVGDVRAIVGFLELAESQEELVDLDVESVEAHLLENVQDTHLNGSQRILHLSILRLIQDHALG